MLEIHGDARSQGEGELDQPEKACSVGEGQGSILVQGRVEGEQLCKRKVKSEHCEPTSQEVSAPLK